jgi:hypothetical protein
VGALPLACKGVRPRLPRVEHGEHAGGVTPLPPRCCART